MTDDISDLERLAVAEGLLRDLRAAIEGDGDAVAAISTVMELVDLLEALGASVLRRHGERCVEDVIASADGERQRRLFRELLSLLARR